MRKEAERKPEAVRQHRQGQTHIGLHQVRTELCHHTPQPSKTGAFWKH